MKDTLWVCIFVLLKAAWRWFILSHLLLDFTLDFVLVICIFSDSDGLFLTADS